MSDCYLTGCLPLEDFSPDFGQALEAIAGHADIADAGHADLSAGLAHLRSAGVFKQTLAYGFADTHSTSFLLGLVDTLRRIGRANLSVGRIVEGHLNALKLVGVFGDAKQQNAVRAAVQSGDLFGVWGADGNPPVVLNANKSKGLILSGRKRFASGLGLVTKALVIARTDYGPQLLLLDVGDAARMDTSTWRTSGMRATASGDYDFEGLSIGPAAFIGRPGDFLREPYFEGGVWRYCAIHVGGMEALAETARAHAIARGFADDPLMAHRLAELARCCETGRLWVEQAALRVEAPGAAELEVAHVLLAREEVERCALRTIALVDRAIGTASFFEGHPAERIRRDLSFFLRQANLDGKLAKAADTLAASDQPFGEMW